MKVKRREKERKKEWRPEKDKKKGKRKRKGREGERSFTFSLEFSAIRQSAFVGAKGISRRELQVEIEIGEFRQTPRGRGFSYSVLFLS